MPFNCADSQAKQKKFVQQGLLFAVAVYSSFACAHDLEKSRASAIACDQTMTNA